MRDGGLQKPENAAFVVCPNNARVRSLAMTAVCCYRLTLITHGLNVLHSHDPWQYGERLRAICTLLWIEIVDRSSAITFEKVRWFNIPFLDCLLSKENSNNIDLDQFLYCILCSNS
jgi:hypothetical protein